MEKEISKMAYYKMPQNEPVVKEKPERKATPTIDSENRPAMTAVVVFEALRKKRQELKNA
jgi:hypothetical protein